MANPKLLGGKVRAVRRRSGMTQADLARRLGISASYLNMIERDRRPLSAPLLIKLAGVLPLDLKNFSGEQDEHLLSDAMEVFGDPVFDRDELVNVEVRDFVSHHPAVARAVLNLYRAYRDSRESVESLASQLADEHDPSHVAHHRQPSEEVHDLIDRFGNYFPELEEGARELRSRAQLDQLDVFPGLAEYLSRTHQTDVFIRTVSEMGNIVRRYEPAEQRLTLSEALRRGSRNFNVAYVVGLLEQSDAIDRIVSDPVLTNDASRAMGRVALANYYAAAVLMPYTAFLEAAQAERYDIDLLGHRFRTSFEQVVHRLTTLGRPGAEGIRLHVVRTDIAGNISKRFSSSGMRFARFSGACSRWHVFSAFLTPGRFRVGLSRMPDGTTFFEVARTMSKESRGYHSRPGIQAISLGCEVSSAREMVYADGIDVDNLEAARKIGVTCRLCNRLDCEDRAFPPLESPLEVDERVRGVSFYTPADMPSQTPGQIPGQTPGQTPGATD